MTIERDKIKPFIKSVKNAGLIAIEKTLSNLKINSGFSINSEITQSGVKTYFTLKSKSLKDINFKAHHNTSKWMLKSILDRKREIAQNIKDEINKIINGI